MRLAHGAARRVGGRVPGGRLELGRPRPIDERPLPLAIPRPDGRDPFLFRERLLCPLWYRRDPFGPYYRDDACFDDGTGDDPSPRLSPGEAFNNTPQGYRDRPCFTEAPDGYEGPYRQGAFGAHRIHYLFLSDTDNGTSTEPLTEIDGQQYQWAARTAAPTNVGDSYATTAKARRGDSTERDTRVAFEAEVWLSCRPGRGRRRVLPSRDGQTGLAKGAG